MLVSYPDGGASLAAHRKRHICLSMLLSSDRRHERRAAGDAAYSHWCSLRRNGIILLLPDRGLPGQDAGKKWGGTGEGTEQSLLLPVASHLSAGRIECGRLYNERGES